MIVSKTPLRVCFFGGGSDLPNYYSNKTGICLSTTIDKYMYVTACKTFVKGFKIVYSEIENVDSYDDIKHDRIRESLKMFNITGGLDISSYAQIPTKGTGLGSSSTFTVSLLNALSTLKGKQMSRHDLAETAFDVEFNKCSEYLGKQDQYAAAFGGFNAFHFSADGVRVEPVNISSERIAGLNNNLLMYYTGITRSASIILRNYDDGESSASMDKMVELGHQALDFIIKNKYDDFGALLHETWQVKKKLASGVSNTTLDDYYETALKSGALGGKILGAGGGGYFLFYVPEQQQNSFKEKMKLTGMQEFNFKFSDEGSKIVCAD